jgi:hypothetical protein
VTFRRLFCVLSLLVVVAGCGPKPVDYRSVLSTPSGPAPTSERPFEDFLKGVNAEAMTPQTLTGLSVSMPRPAGWVAVPNDNQLAAFEVNRKSAVAAYQPTAMLLVFKLTGADFDINEALKHAFNMPGAIVEPFNGIPSSRIEYTSPDRSGQAVHHYNRMVIATTRAPANQRYLVQFSITAAADGMEQSPDVLEIIKGFNVTLR